MLPAFRIGTLVGASQLTVVRLEEGILVTRAAVGELLESEEADVCFGGGDGVIGDNEEGAGWLPLLRVWSGVDEEGVRRDRIILVTRRNT
jgi:hypothetical protein